MFEIILVTFFALLPISNPFSTIPLYLSLTAGHSAGWSRKQAFKAVMYMAGILLVFLWAGALIIDFFGISVPAIRVAGGAIILQVGFKMLNSQGADDIPEEAKQESRTKKDIAFTPLAMPSLSGPGSISVVISMAASSDNFLEYLAVSIGILAVVFVAWLAMRSAPLVSQFLGITGLDALTKIMGFILICIAFQFIFDGFGGYFSSERFLQPIIENIQLMQN